MGKTEDAFHRFLNEISRIQNSVFVFSHPFRSFAGMLDYNLGRTKYPLDLNVVGTYFENMLNGRHQG